ncbi:DUF1579 family protein [Leptospira sp. GIMC2001]|uniref:DUF1579 family protein n=1 Tax=Leptospira sp. GIMC2001 TaxID=1513297 RepID=UPI00234BA9BC|nr:DUF1579 family protein [Leptospira sp. GIMC2001]WCL50621.1 DUF1579 family protein [Leptospira sp. GIMC2001]
MKIKDIHNKFIGNWTGEYRLILSWLPDPDFISISNMKIEKIANQNFLLMKYDWFHESQKQDGLLLLGNENLNSEVTASWVDSWGMSGKIMNCYGTISDQGNISLLGSYEVRDSPDWGWRIEIPYPEESQMQIRMYNISPNGETSLAGEATYKQNLDLTMDIRK